MSARELKSGTIKETNRSGYWTVSHLWWFMCVGSVTGCRSLPCLPFSFTDWYLFVEWQLDGIYTHTHIHIHHRVLLSNKQVRPVHRSAIKWQSGSLFWFEKDLFLFPGVWTSSSRSRITSAAVFVSLMLLFFLHILTFKIFESLIAQRLINVKPWKENGFLDWKSWSKITEMSWKSISWLESFSSRVVKVLLCKLCVEVKNIFWTPWCVFILI